MWAYIRSFVRRNRRRLLVSSGIVAVLYLSTRYLQKKLVEFQERIKEENFTKEQIKRRFHQTQKDCYMTFVSLVSVLDEPILGKLPVEKIFKELQMIRLEKQLVNNESKLGTSTIVSDDFPSESAAGAAAVDNNSITAPDATKKSKAELWSELKITTVARFLAVIYAQSVLVVLIHIQLNILSRKAYLNSAIDLASKTQGIKLYEDEEVLKLEQEDTEGEKKFLSLTYFLMSKGYQRIIDEVVSAVHVQFDAVNVRKELTLDEFFDLIVACKINLDLDYVKVLGLAEEDEEEDEDDQPKDEKFENLKAELVHYIETDDVKAVLDSLVTQNVAYAKSNVTLAAPSAKLATLLIQLTKNTPNSNTECQLQLVDALGDVSASVYSNF